MFLHEHALNEVGNEFGNLVDEFVKVVTCTRTSDHFAKTDMQL